jgi:hypothetical protein
MITTSRKASRNDPLSIAPAAVSLNTEVKTLTASLAQLDRAADFESAGRGFESLTRLQPSNVRPGEMRSVVCLRQGWLSGLGRTSMKPSHASCAACGAESPGCGPSGHSLHAHHHVQARSANLRTGLVGGIDTGWRQAKSTRVCGPFMPRGGPLWPPSKVVITRLCLALTLPWAAVQEEVDRVASRVSISIVVVAVPAARPIQMPVTPRFRASQSHNPSGAPTTQ